MSTCIICDNESSTWLCDSCGRSYDRSSNADGGTVMEAMEWAADRAARLRGCARLRGQGVSIFFDADDLVMLHDRVSAEEPGWEELLAKVEQARAKLAARRLREDAEGDS